MFLINIFVVSLFGHREIDDLRQLDKELSNVIKELLKLKPYVSFLIGRNGEFDEYSASVIKRIQKEVGKEYCDISLILPYSVSQIEYYEKYYDSIVIPDTLYKIHPKSIITFRNRWMIERSDLIITYVNHRSGGAYTAMKYAKKLNKRVINLTK